MLAMGCLLQLPLLAHGAGAEGNQQDTGHELCLCLCPCPCPVARTAPCHPARAATAGEGACATAKGPRAFILFN